MAFKSDTEQARLEYEHGWTDRQTDRQVALLSLSCMNMWSRDGNNKPESYASCFGKLMKNMGGALFG